MALAAELLLTGGMSKSKQLSRQQPNVCEMCKKVERRYKCPGCSVQTCSLECCKLHKEKLGCDGRRDETAFKMLNQFNDNVLLSDYLFLEKASRMVNSTRRGFRKFSLELRPEWVSKLCRACSRRRIDLRTVAPHMSRGFLNKTCFLPKRDVIMWQIEWIFPSINRKYIQSSVFEYNRVPDALFSLITTNNTAAPILRPYKMHYSLKASSHPENDEQEVKEEPKAVQRQQDCALTFLLHVKPTRYCYDRWRLIEKEKTLAANLRLQCIVEHPTIVVLLPGESAEPYLSKNGRVPAWIAAANKKTAATAPKIQDSIKIQEKAAEAKDEKEDGEISEESEEEQESADDETRGVIVDSEDEAICSAKKMRLLDLPKDEPSTSALPKALVSLVAYGDGDSEEDENDD